MYKYLITLAILFNCLAVLAQRRPPFGSPFNPFNKRDSAIFARRDIIARVRRLSAFPTEPMLNFAFEPIFTFNNAFKFDIAYKPADKRYAIELTPEFYTGPHVLDHNKDQISGIGIGLYHQIYLLDSNDHAMIISYGATYRNINVAYSDEGFISYHQNGLDYYQYKNFDDVLKTNGVLVNVNFGIRLTNNTSPVFVDLYVGVGYKFSSGKATYPGYRTYTSNVWNYAYRGPMILAGVKVGPRFLFKNHPNW